MTLHDKARATPPSAEATHRQSLRDVLLRRPVILWLIFLAAVTVIGVTAKALVPDLLSGPAGVSPLQVGLQCAMLLMVLPFAIRVGRRGLGFGKASDWHVLLFPALTIAFGYAMGFRELALSALLLALASVVLAGVVEEVAFRGVLLGSLLRRGVWPAVAISSAMFGLMHLSNLALGSPWYTVLLQLSFAAMAGTGYAAMRLRTGSIWPAIILHAAFDLTFRVGALEPGSMFTNAVHMLHGVGWLIYALVVLRKSKRSQLP